jgi:small ligand-binding sensory domain FIST
VTRGQHNVLVELDGQSALQVFQADVGETLARNPERVAGQIFAALPVRGSDTGDYLVRNLLGIDPDNGLVAIGSPVATGGQVRFCRRDARTARDDLRRMLRAVKAGLSSPPRGGLYFSCLGRGASLFGPGSAELGLVREELGDLPLAGFYANGEISFHRLYGYTGVLTLFL